MIGVLIRFNASEDSSVTEPEVIAPLCYGCLDDRLADSTETIVRRAAEYARKFPHARIAFSNATHCFAGCEARCSEMKAAIFEEEGIAPERILEADPMANSLQEAEAIRRRLDHASIRPRRILVVTGQIHSRRARLVWSRTYPSAAIMLKTVEYLNECQPDHPVLLQRSYWKLFTMNVVHHAVLQVPGGAWLTNNLRHVRAR
jgi:uncharacterized SAM-binding protein YcdF (DUF218 family)